MSRQPLELNIILASQNSMNGSNYPCHPAFGQVARLQRLWDFNPKCGGRGGAESKFLFMLPKLLGCLIRCVRISAYLKMISLLTGVLVLQWSAWPAGLLFGHRISEQVGTCRRGHGWIRSFWQEPHMR